MSRKLTAGGVRIWKGIKLGDAGDIDVLEGNVGSLDAYQRPSTDDDISVPGLPRQTPERIRNIVPCIVDIEHDHLRKKPSCSLFTIFQTAHDLSSRHWLPFIL